MSFPDRSATPPVGLVRINSHCLFTWRGRADGDPATPTRYVEVHDDHCDGCIDAALTSGFGTVDMRSQERGGLTPSGKHRAVG